MVLFLDETHNCNPLAGYTMKSVRKQKQNKKEEEDSPMGGILFCLLKRLLTAMAVNWAEMHFKHMVNL